MTLDQGGESQLEGPHGTSPLAVVLTGFLPFLLSSGRAQAAHIWVDGDGEIRGKTTTLDAPIKSIKELKEWNFDGSSTNQAEGHSSDCVLKPVASYPDPIRGGDNVLVLCEVYNTDDSPHPSNTRAVLRPVVPPPR